MVGVEKVSVSKMWDSRDRTGRAAVEVRWTTKLPESTHAGGLPPGVDIGRRRSEVEAEPYGGRAEGQLPKVVEKGAI